MKLLKKAIRSAVLWAVVLTGSYMHLYGQYGDISFNHISTVDGLSNFTVLAITQDHLGYMWFGTMDGLNRYDGNSIKIYKEDTDDPYSLGSSYVWSLLCVSDSGIWVGSNRGLYWYDYRYDNFKLLPLTDKNGEEHNILSIRSLLATGNILWIGTRVGLYRYNMKTGEFIYLDHNEDPHRPIGNVIAQKTAEDGTVWIGDSHGLLKYQHGKFTRIPLALKGRDDVILQGLGIEIDGSGRIWLGTDNTDIGLIIYDPKDQTFRTLSQATGHLPHNRVKSLFRLPDGNIFTGTRWGLGMINEFTFDSRHFTHDRFSLGSISQNSIRQIYQSRNGVIWIGTYSGGVNYFDPKSQRIIHLTNKHDDENSLNFNIVSYIYEDSERNIWIGTENKGVNIFNESVQLTGLMMTETHDLVDDNIKCILEDTLGRILISTQFGISIFDSRKEAFKNLTGPPGNGSGWLSHHIVHGLCLDRIGNIWIGPAGKPGQCHLQMYNTREDTIIHYPPLPGDYEWIKGMETHTMVIDNDRDIVWSGGSQGLVGFDLESRGYLHDSAFYFAVSQIKDVVINDLLIDGAGKLWIATFGHGLYSLDMDSYNLREIKGDESIRGRSFYALVQDLTGNIWASTNASILKFVPKGNEMEESVDIEEFGIQEGFPAQQYFRNAAMRGSNGMLYFGGDNGMISFDPSGIENIVIHPMVTVQDIVVNGRSLEMDSEAEGQHLNIGIQDAITLTHQQSSFTVQFIAPNFINPDNTWYQYRVIGINDSWQELGKSNSIHFTELKAGEYELRLKASSDPLDFSRDFTRLKIEIRPPAWGTPLAYFIYFIVLLGLLYLFFMISRRWERLRQHLRFEQLEKEKEKEFSQRRIKFFMDISHELRTPLTLMLTPLERIVQSNFGSAKIKNQLLLMLRNGERMLQLINQVLDLRRLETGNVRIKAAKGNIAGFTEEVSLSFRELARDRNIAFHVEQSGEKIEAWFDRNRFEIILFNLLSNALKYTPDQGKILIQIVEDPGAEGNIIIRIENTGMGIPEQHVKHIFNRFYTAHETKDPTKYSSGVGLEIVKNLVELHHGEIAVESTYDVKAEKGLTCFTIKLKKGKDHFSADEIQEDFKSSEDLTSYLIPVAPEALKEDYEETNEEKIEGIEGQREESILIVEDNREIRELVAGIFNPVYNTYLAGNGIEGLKIALDIMPDLIISDVVMPGMDGIELCKKIKTDVNTSHIPVILLTARTAVTFKYEGLETGADDYIVKPFSAEDLRLRSGNLIRQRKLLKERFGQTGLSLPSRIAFTSVDEKLLQRTIDIITEQMGNNELTVDWLAREIGMSRANFYRKIKALTNMSASEFLRKVRIDHAAQLLKTNKFRISEVASMVGFSDTDYFRDCFKSQHGMTPKAFAESLRT